MDKVKRITEILEAWQETGTDYIVIHSFNSLAHEISKLFEPPDDEKLRETIRRLVVSSIDISDGSFGVKEVIKLISVERLVNQILSLCRGQEAKAERERILNDLLALDGWATPEQALKHVIKALKEGTE